MGKQNEIIGTRSLYNIVTTVRLCFLYIYFFVFSFVLFFLLFSRSQERRAAILDNSNEKLGPPFPPFSMMGKWARFGFCGDSSLIRGEGGSNFSFYSVQDCRSSPIFNFAINPLSPNINIRVLSDLNTFSCSIG